MSNYGKFSLGADVEVFVQREGKYVSAIPHCQGTKEKPLMLGNGVFIMYDNVAIEFGCRPATDKRGFIDTIDDSLVALRRYLDSKNLTMKIDASTMFPISELSHPKAQEFGCSPDYNAWTFEKNEMSAEVDPKFRSCGGHLHFGYIEGSGNDFLKDSEGRASFIRVCDCTFGLISTMLDTSSASIQRRQLYGKPGCYRETSYGVEYRTLSNFWIKSPFLVGLMYELANDSMMIMRQGFYIDIIMDIGIDKVQQIIMEGDVDAAADLMDGGVYHYLRESTIMAISGEIIANSGISDGLTYWDKRRIAG